MTTDAIAFSVPGEPMGKQSPRVVRANGFTRAHMPAATVNAMQAVRLYAAEAMGGRPPMAGPVCVEITAYRAKGMKSMSKKRRAMAEHGELVPSTKPDADNYAKMVCDGCNGVLYGDDGQVADLVVRKRYSERPRVDVICYPFGGARWERGRR